jgi:hypothetical protein
MKQPRRTELSTNRIAWLQIIYPFGQWSIQVNELGCQWHDMDTSSVKKKCYPIGASLPLDRVVMSEQGRLSGHRFATRAIGRACDGSPITLSNNCPSWMCPTASPGLGLSQKKLTRRYLSGNSNSVCDKTYPGHKQNETILFPNGV